MQNAECIMQNYLVDVLHIDDKIFISSTTSFSILLNSCSVRKSVLYNNLMQYDDAECKMHFVLALLPQRNNNTIKTIVCQEIDAKIT